MPTVAVVVHTKKADRRDIDRVREALRVEGAADGLWHEVRKSKKAAARAREAADAGADVVVAWGGDGTVQRCIDALAGRDVALAVIPAGTSNLLAGALGVPDDVDEAVRVALGTGRRALDTGTANGEHFAVVAGAGLDALLVRDASRELKGRVGRLAYLYAGLKNLRFDAQAVHVTVDGRRVFRGRSTSVLVGNTPRAVGGMDVFESCRPDDGVLEVGVVTARGPVQWVRAAVRAALGTAEHSPFLRTARGRDIVVRFGRPVPYEIDGGERDPARELRVSVHPRSITVCVPVERVATSG